ncbi:hypothetical protein K505DRAFT_115630, partial [Melanomma pulvis-pyrius CBS 109.77]
KPTNPNIYPTPQPTLHIRPQEAQSRQPRPILCTELAYRQTSSQVGDHWRIPAVVCFWNF